MDVLLIAVVAVLAVLGMIVVGGVKMVQQYQRGVVLRFGRLLPRVREPGLQLIIPFVDQMTKVPVQTVVMDVPSQGAITRDNVTLSVDAVVYFRVVDPAKAVVNVENYLGAVSQVSQTSLRSVIGRADLDTVLSDREKVNAELRAVIDTPTEDWGISVDRVEVKDVSLPEAMRRSMSRQAEAERERRARIIAADGEYQASARLADAAREMGETPGAMQLRLLQTLSGVAAERNNTVVMPFPIEMLRFFERTAAAQGARVAEPAGEDEPDGRSAPPALEPPAPAVDLGAVPEPRAEELDEPDTR
ncbi:MAG TPA: SPFH domain-containing protein [Pseudonocardia sp.]|jgi:regulator of protease activity HflC (stomatin/prohibitin superfamily)|nr:SPFH domain-containing protein [Pseudonocardia sp.]